MALAEFQPRSIRPRLSVDAPCPGGSEPQVGAPQFFTLDDAYIAGKFGSFAGWLTTWAMGLPASPQVTADFCSKPPPLEYPTAEDWLKLATPPIALATGTYTRFGNWILAQKWHDLCQCKSGTQTCHINTSGNVQWGTAGQPSNTTVVPYGATTLAWQMTAPDYGNWIAIENVLDASNSPIAGWTNNENGELGQTYSRTSTLPNGAKTVVTRLWQGRDEPATGSWTGTVDYTPCDTVPPVIFEPPPVVQPPPDYPPAPIAGPCTSFADICIMLSNLQNKLDWTRMELQLLQRWSEPFAYRYGRTIPGLTGAGQLEIDRLLGLQVVLTKVTPGAKVARGGTPYIFDQGWMSVEDPEGMVEEKRITRQAFTWLPARMALATTFKYDLFEGAELAIAELLPEH